MRKETLQRLDMVPVSVREGMNGEARAFVMVLVRQVDQLTRRIVELERRFPGNFKCWEIGLRGASFQNRS